MLVISSTISSGDIKLLSSMNNVRSVEQINEEELKHGLFGGLSKGSWHEKYRNSAWVYFGGLSYELTEGDIICVMSQWGEIEDIHLIREQDTGKSKGFAFVKYEDARSTILAVDNFNGAKLLGRTLRCDHVENYKLPKHIREKEEENLKQNPDAGFRMEAGHAYKDKELASAYNIDKGVDLWRKSSEESDSADSVKEERNDSREKKHKSKKHKKEKKEKKSKHSKRLLDDDSFSERRQRRSSSRSPNRRSELDGDILPLPQVDRAEAVRMPVSENSSFPAEGPVASWRGRRDPSFVSATDIIAKPKGDSDRPPEKRRDELSGIAGYNRLR